MASVEMKTIVKGNGYKRTTDIPSTEIDCQYYKQVEVGDVLWGGHVVTQDDIDNGHARLIGFNCGSPVVDWMSDGPDSYVGQYYLTNPFEEGGVGEDGELFNHGPGGCGTGCNVNGMGTCEECVGSGITPPADSDFDGVEDCIQEGFGGTCWDGITCWNTLDSIPFDCPPQWPYGDDPGVGYGEEQGGPGGNQPTIKETCCDPNEDGVEEHFAINGMGPSPLDDDFGYVAGACEHEQCVAKSITEGPIGSQVHYRHHSKHCLHPVKNWNVLWQHSDQNNRNADYSYNHQAERHRFYPYFDNNHISGSNETPYMKYYPDELPAGHSSYATIIPENFQKSRYQKNQFYEVDIYQTIDSCDEAYRVKAGLYSPYRVEILGQHVMCEPYTQTGYTGACIRSCIDSDIVWEQIYEFIYSSYGTFYLQAFFASTDIEILRKVPENRHTDTADFVKGYGLGWWLDLPSSDGVFGGDFDWGHMADAMAPVIKDVLYRLGFPIPPVAIGFDYLKDPSLDYNGPPHCENVSLQYLQSIYEWRGFLNIAAFFDDFIVPGVTPQGVDDTGLIEPTMNSVYDPLSGIDYRNDSQHKNNLSACSYLEFMTLPGGTTNGDGIYYRPDEIPSQFITQHSNNSAKSEQIRGANCNTEVSIFNNLIFSRIRVTCNDGSTEVIMQGDNNTEGLTTQFATTGNGSCLKNIKNRSTQDLFYLSNADDRVSLGIFYPDSINLAKDNFSSNLESQYSQLAKPNRITNGSGTKVDETGEDIWATSTDISNSDNWNAIGINVSSQTFTPDNWRPIAKPDYDSVNNYQPSDKIMPYWVFNDDNCYSGNKCLIFDYSQYSQLGIDAYDERQGWKYNIDRNTMAGAFGYGQSYKVSFLMKTENVGDESLLHSTGVHVVFNFFDDPNDEPAANFKNPTENQLMDPFDDIDDPSQILVVKNSNSQCGENSHTYYRDVANQGFFQKNPYHYGFSLADDDDLYCNLSRASFTNSKVGEWQRMEFTLQAHEIYKYIASVEGYQDPDTPTRKDASLPMSIQFYDLNYAKGGFNIDGHFQNQLDNNTTPATVYIDEVELKESFDFHPDVFVRKRLSATEFGSGDLTKYFDPEIEEQRAAYNDTTAPLEIGCYFYPRFAHDDIFSPRKNVMVQEFKFGQFFISDLDWGDGSSLEYTSSPLKLSFNTMAFHSYEKPGIYEIRGTMFQIKPDEYIWDIIPENITYNGIGGVAANRTFILRINVNEGGGSEDFPYFGSDGFSFIPFLNPTPIIGGYSTQSSYYKNIKRNLGMMGPDDDIDYYVDINYGKIGDRFKTEVAMWKMDSNYLDYFQSLPAYLTPINPNENTDPAFLETLPFPTYLEEFNTPYGNTDLINQDDADWWGFAGRPDIKANMQTWMDIGSESDLPPQGKTEAVPFWTFVNPTNPAALLTSEDGTYTTGDERWNKVRDGLGKSIGDVDLSNIRYYYKRFTLFDMLGFEEQEENIEQYFSTDSVDTSPEYLATLRFPTYMSEFDIYNNGIDFTTQIHWENEGRPDIGMMIQHLLLFPDNVDDFYESLNNANEDIGYTFPTNIQLPLSDEGYSVGEVAIHYTGNTMTGYIGAGPITDINTFVGGEEFFPLSVGINTYACADVFGGSGIPGSVDGYKFSAESLSTIVDDENRNYDVYECIPGNIIVLPSSSFFNLTGFTTLSNHPENPISPRYWKNYIPKDYSIFNRKGIDLDSNLIDIYSQQEWLDDYYYPVLPKHGADGKFIEGDYPNDNIPFPLNGPITENKHSEPFLLFEVNNEEIDVNVFDDTSGNSNFGHGVSDFKPNFDDATLEPKTTRKMSKIKTSTLTKAF